MSTNWLQLVEFTAEHTPGQWHPYRSEDGRSYEVFTDARGEHKPCAGSLVAAVYSCGDGIGDEEAAEAFDYERLANMRLIADAPKMLVLLASVLNAYDMAEKFPTVARELVKSHRDLITQLMLRHVRIGCAPVDAESRTDTPNVYPGTDVGEYKPHSGE